jgi:hypothetical protein
VKLKGPTYAEPRRLLDSTVLTTDHQTLVVDGRAFHRLESYLVDARRAYLLSVEGLLNMLYLVLQACAALVVVLKGWSVSRDFVSLLLRSLLL